MANWKKVLVSGSSIEVRNITASDLPINTSGDAKLVVYDTSTGTLAYTSSAAGGGGVFVNQGDFANTGNGTPKSIYITGSVLQPSPDTAPTEIRGASATNNNYALVVSQSAYFSNHNVGHPNSLAWQSNLEGSIFNNYDANTDVAEILRTFVGILSASGASGTPVSVASPTPFAETYNGYRQEAEGLASTTTTFTNIYLPVGYTEANAVYLNGKGFNGGAGTGILSSVTGDIRIDTDASYGVQIDLRNSANSYGGEFDAGSNSTPLTIFADVTQSFSDTQTENDPDEISNTFTTQSIFTYSVNAGSSTNGITVTEIPTDAPTVIPPQFKKATGIDIPLQSSRKYASSGEDFTNIASSGYYKYHGIKVGVATGSGATKDTTIGGMQDAVATTNINTSFFHTPLQVGDITDTAATFATKFTSSSFTSRSLSGAPYLNGATYSAEVTASNVFKPLYRANATVLDGSITGTTLTFSGDSTQTATIDSSGNVSTANRIYDGDTARSTGADPGVNDTCRITETYSFGASDAYESNMGEGAFPGGQDTTFTYRATTLNFANSSTNDDTDINYHTAGTFGQPVDSGSLAYFISDDGDDTAPGNQVSTTSTEYFGGEGYRRPIEATTDLADSNAWDSGSRLTLGNGGDLQVKPGYLVNPEASAHGYWYPTTGYSNTDYKWYLREFDTGETETATNLVLTFNSISDFVPLSTTTSNKIGIGVLLEYQLNNLGGGNPYIYDVVEGTDGANGDVSLGQSNSNQYNPFSDTVDVLSGWGAASDNGTTTITLGLAAGQKQVINGTYSKVYLLVRYTGDPGNNLENIVVSTT